MLLRIIAQSTLTCILMHKKHDTSVFFNEASATQARESKKSPANTANCFTDDWGRKNNNVRLHNLDY